MKILTKEEEDAHYSAVLRGGTIGTVAGLIGGWAGVLAATRRYQAFRQLTIPLRAFLVTSTGTFCGIIAADHSSRRFEAERNFDQTYLENREERRRREELSRMTFADRATAWAHEEKYKIIGASWILSIVGSFALVNRNPYLTGQQKIVQARVYAQGLTLAVMCATAAFEIHDQRKGEGLLDAARKKGNVPAVEHHERYEGEDLWKDMVAAEEQRLKKLHQSVSDKEEKDRRTHSEQKSQEKNEKKDEKEDKEEKKEEKKE
ncbi:mitochondrial hypoxia responsive domain protein [Paecilomyces variotii No. 5]|uniref:Mitochondrial hypoxia responsive domain protein n=1 Tax=Byssochlamys spectabilis (strain No. 5 / NBRC 109023) TaxID=1356009 RepID=V5FD21_BYSSN|nr:mitochondrial hypoxia responsive domain protein [Paecilomyces variotii No. 5]